MRLSGIRVGASDLERSRAFYDAVLGALGASPAPAGRHPVLMYRIDDALTLIVGNPRDGNAASGGNGQTILLAAESDADVDSAHAAALAHGGSCEGPPGPREKADGARGTYFRDPDGNKFGVYHGLKIGQS